MDFEHLDTTQVDIDKFNHSLKTKYAIYKVRELLKNTAPDGVTMVNLRIYLVESFGFGTTALKRWLTDWKIKGEITQKEDKIYWVV